MQTPQAMIDEITRNLARVPVPRFYGTAYFFLTHVSVADAATVFERIGVVEASDTTNNVTPDGNPSWLVRFANPGPWFLIDYVCDHAFRLHLRECWDCATADEAALRCRYTNLLKIIEEMESELAAARSEVSKAREELNQYLVNCKSAIEQQGKANQ